MLEFLGFTAVFLLGELLRLSFLDRLFVSRRSPNLRGRVGEHDFRSIVGQYGTMMWSLTGTIYGVSLLIAEADLPSGVRLLLVLAGFLLASSLGGIGIRTDPDDFFRAPGWLAAHVNGVSALRLNRIMARALCPYAVLVVTPVLLNLCVAVVI